MKAHRRNLNTHDCRDRNRSSSPVLLLRKRESSHHRTSIRICPFAGPLSTLSSGKPHDLVRQKEGRRRRQDLCRRHLRSPAFLHAHSVQNDRKTQRLEGPNFVLFCLSRRCLGVLMPASPMPSAGFDLSSASPTFQPGQYAFRSMVLAVRTTRIDPARKANFSARARLKREFEACTGVILYSAFSPKLRLSANRFEPVSSRYGKPVSAFSTPETRH